MVIKLQNVRQITSSLKKLKITCRRQRSKKVPSGSPGHVRIDFLAVQVTIEAHLPKGSRQLVIL